jgi:hypothetical protein
MSKGRSFFGSSEVLFSESIVCGLSLLSTLGDSGLGGCISFLDLFFLELFYSRITSGLLVLFSGLSSFLSEVHISGSVFTSFSRVVLSVCEALFLAVALITDSSDDVHELMQQCPA